MSHMWNLVKIGSDWYHTDVTWDDPLNSRNQADQYGIVYHDNFLISTAALKKTGHYAITFKNQTKITRFYSTLKMGIKTRTF